MSDNYLPSVVRADWASFFSLKIEMPEDFLVARDDLPPQQRPCIELMLNDAEPA